MSLSALYAWHVVFKPVAPPPLSNSVVNFSTNMSQQSTPEMANPHQARLMASNHNLLQTGKYSDLVIKCGAKEWNVHRSIVCEGSKFLATACDGPFMVSGFAIKGGQAWVPVLQARYTTVSWQLTSISSHQGFLSSLPRGTGKVIEHSPF